MIPFKGGGEARVLAAATFNWAASLLPSLKKKGETFHFLLDGWVFA